MFRNGSMQLRKKKKGNQVKLTNKIKVKVESIGRVKIKLYNNYIKIFDKIRYAPREKLSFFR